MTRMFIEDQELDVNQEFSHQVSYAIDDLQNLDSKSTSVTKTLILPGSANNNRLLGNIFEINNANFTGDVDDNVGYNFNASRQAKARIEVNGLTVIKGVLRLLEVIIDGELIEYEVAVFGELGGFVAKLGNARLEDLDFSAYDHQYVVSNIVNSWDDWNAGQGYYYPLIDYGNVSVDKINYQYRAFRPALFVREYVDKIITGAGYTWESDFFNTDFFKRLIIPNNQKRLLILKTRAFYGTPEETFIAISNSGVGFNEPIRITNFVGGIFTTSDNRVYTYTGSSTTFRLSALLKGTWGSNTSGVNIRFEVYKNGATFYTSPIAVGGSSSGSYNYPIDIDIPMDNGDTFNIQAIILVLGSGIIGFSMFVLPTSTLTLDSQVPVLVTPELGDTLPMGRVIPPNIFQRDFFASMLKLFNLMVTEDKNRERHLKIEPWTEFFNTSEYEDWSDKVDRSSPVRIKPMSEVNARYYQLKYKSDSDYYNDNYRKQYNEGYGDRIYDNSLDFAKDTETTEVIFASSVLTGFDGTDKIVPAIYKKTNGIEDPFDHVIRIMQAKKIEGVTNWGILNGTTVLDVNNSYPYAGHFDDPDAPDADLNFGATKELYFTLASGALSNNLFNAYYSPYLAEVTDKDSRLLTVKMKLTEKDIYNLDFSKLKYIDGGLYRLSKINDYSEGELCKVDLLRVIYTTY